MQLNLFEDNNRQILLNIADEFLSELDFELALPIYTQLLQTSPDDQQISALLMLANDLSKYLDDPSTDWHDPDQLYLLYQRQKLIAHPPLYKAIQTFIIEILLSQPEPHAIYHPPDFHIGFLLIEAKRLQEAAELLQAALLLPGLPTGRFLAWYGDTLTLMKLADEALEWYLAALVLYPDTVLPDALASRNIRSLLISLQVEADGEIPEEHELAWLPVWGVLERLFTLPLSERIMQLLTEGDDLSEKASDTGLSVPTRWFYLLLQAEELRLAHADTSVRAAVRRTMKELNNFMFCRYLSLIAESTSSRNHSRQ